MSHAPASVLILARIACRPNCAPRGIRRIAAALYVTLGHLSASRDRRLRRRRSADRPAKPRPFVEEVDRRLEVPRRRQVEARPRRARRVWPTGRPPARGEQSRGERSSLFHVSQRQRRFAAAAQPKSPAAASRGWPRLSSRLCETVLASFHRRRPRRESPKGARRG